MSHRSFFISAAFVVLLFSFSARAQEPTPATGPDKSAAAATKEKAVDLLRSIAGQVESLSSAQNRARIGSNAADLLWEIDEERSRRLFSAVAEDIKAGLAEVNDDSSYVDLQQFNQFNAVAVFGQLRSDTLERISRHDPQLALEFLRATRPTLEQMPYAIAENEKSLELRLAGQIAAKSPELALKLGRQVLANDLRPDLVSVLKQLKPGDTDWRSFYKEVVDKLKAVNLNEDYEAQVLAIALARSFSPPQADEQVYRELISVVFERAVYQDCANSQVYYGDGMCYEIGLLFPKIEKYYGPRAASLKNLGERASERETQQRVTEAAREGTIDEALALAANHPDMAEDLYWQAMVKATQVSDYSRAREVARKNPNEEQRRRMLDQIEYAEKVTAENSSENPSRASQPKSDQERLTTLLITALHSGKSDRQEALKRIYQAEQIIESVTPEKTKLELQIGLAILYATSQSDRGFTIVASLIPRLNELISAAAALDGVEMNYLSEGEWNMTGAGTLGRLLTALAQNAGHFARLDFDRSLALANQLERSEVRLMAQLMMVQGILSNRSAGHMTIPGN
jgi:hypothetical protein